MEKLDQDFKYLSKGYDINYKKQKRSAKKKLFIVFSFIGLLALVPSFIYLLTESEQSGTKNVVIVEKEEQIGNIEEPTGPEVHTVIIESAKPSKDETFVINNDSYWKISKRVCGEGKFYLSISEQNKSKALYEGDIVFANCTL